MSEMNMNSDRQMTIRHRGRGSQIPIYLGKLLRMFIYQNDWKVLPMAAIIAGLVGMVIRKRLFITMEGTLIGSFALVMVCIWNGCFNSIQVICRERDVIKRRHRSGMHISSYIASHMIYQSLLCLLQTVVTLYVTKMVGVKYDLGTPAVTRWFLVDFGISMFLITYASDMLSLWVSCLAKSTTTAMTIMPFVLIFQLVFSGGMMSLPAWTKGITPLTISNPALKVLTAQGDYNSRPVMTIWNTVDGMRDREISETVTLGQVYDLLQNEKIESVAALRSTDIGEALKLNAPVEGSGESDQADLPEGEMPENHVTVGELIDAIVTSPEFEAHRSDGYTFRSTVGGLIEAVGEEKVADILQNRVAEASRNSSYDNTRDNILNYWMRLLMFVFVFAAFSTITLEFIDKDKR